jgi:VanZ family protein
MAAGRLTLQLVFLASIVAVAVLSLVPPADEPSVSFLSDKLQHASAYAWLALVGSTAMRSKSARIAMVVLLPLLGAAIELLQFLVPGRAPEVADALANLIGTLLGAGLHRLLGRLWALRGRPAT